MIVSGNGRVSADIQISKSKSGKEYVAFDLATDRGYGDKKVTDWYKCVAYDEMAQRLANANVKKGASIFIVANQAMEEYTKDGVKRINTKLTILDWNFIQSGKPKESKETGNAEVLNADDELPLA